MYSVTLTGFTSEEEAHRVVSAVRVLTDGATRFAAFSRGTDCPPRSDDFVYCDVEACQPEELDEQLAPYPVTWHYPADVPRAEAIGVVRLVGQRQAVRLALQDVWGGSEWFEDEWPTLFLDPCHGAVHTVFDTGDVCQNTWPSPPDEEDDACPDCGSLPGEGETPGCPGCDVPAPITFVIIH